MTSKKKVKKVVADAAFTDGAQEQTFKEWILSKLDAMFIDNIPLKAIRELPIKYMYIAGSIAHATAIACLLYFIIQGFRIATTKQFISVSSGDGVCESVSRENGGTYMATDTGWWEGANDYEPALAIYKIEFYSFAMRDDDYRALIRAIKTEVRAIAAGAPSRDAAHNLLYWMTWEIDSANFLFEFTGRPVDVFNRYYTIGYLATVEGTCEMVHKATYNGANSLLRMEYEYAPYINNSVCSAVADPYQLGYKPNYDFESFRVDLDLHACLIAISVSKKVLRISDLSLIPNTTEVVPTAYGPMVLNKYFDDRFGTMEPIFCFVAEGLDGDLTNEACMVKISEVYAFPVMNHFGEYSFDNGEFPKKCDCSGGMINALSYCHVSDIVIGALFYNTTSPEPLFELIHQYGAGGINELAYNISVDAIEDVLTDKPRKDAYAFCNLAFGPCSVAMFNTFDNLTRSVSPYHYQVPYPACTDSFDISDEAWARLEAAAPVELTEKYFSCTQNPTDAMFNAIGIATGNTAITVPIVCILCLPILYAYMQAMHQKPPKEEYSKNELQAAENALALIILRIRDGKLRGVKKDSVLLKLTKDLVSAAKSEGGYADSDDDSDSDDEDAPKQPKRKSRKSGRNQLSPNNVFITKKVQEEESPKTGFFGGLFSSSNSEESATRETEFGLPVVDVAELVILNDCSPKHSKSVDEKSYFSEIDRIIGAMQRAMTFQDIEGGSRAFKIAKDMTDVLRYVALDKTVDNIERGQLSLKIYNLLLLHICLEYSCSMSEAIDKYSFVTAYNIGGKAYSGADLLRMKNREI